MCMNTIITYSLKRTIMSILQLKNINLTLGDKQILNNLSVEFWEGHIHAIVGPNGAGKSTLAYTIMGLSGYRKHDGDIIFKDQSISNLKIDERAKLGITLAWQEPARFEGLTVRDFLLSSSRDKNIELAKDCLDKVGLNPNNYLYRAVDKTLSGGERKRIEIASILSMKPALVLMDEPDSGIDVAALDHIFKALEILKNNNSTVIMITHSPTVLSHAEHAFLLCCGKIADKGSKDKISQYFKQKCLPCDHKNRPLENEFPIDASDLKEITNVTEY